jgi:hypothetical protein
MTHRKPRRLGLVKALFLFIALALVFTFSLSLRNSSKADEIIPQVLLTRDLAANPAEVVLLGANADDNLGGNGTKNTFTDLSRARPLVSGDFNRDGIQDLAMGAPNADYTPPGAGSVARANAGAVYVLFGRNTFTNQTIIDTNPASVSQPDVRIYGALADDNVGFSLAVGDINGDGGQDLIIGAPGVSFGSPLRTDTGAVYVLLGSSTLTPRTIDLVQNNVINLIIYGERAGDRFGTSLDAGDVGGATTVADILVGAVGSKGPANDRTDAGAAFVIFGGTALTPDPPTTTLVTDLAATPPPVRIFGTNGSLFGSSVAIGNLNNTGPGDVLVGAPKANRPVPVEAADTGAVYMINGGANLLPASGAVKNFDIALIEQNLSIYGNSSGDHLGASITAGDVTNDAIDDLVAGAPDADGPADARPDAGEVYVINGSSTLPARINISLTNVQLTVYGNANNDHAGSTVAIGVITNNGNTDSVPEVIFGAPGAQGNKGTVHVLYGGASLEVVSIRDLSLPQDDIRVFGLAAEDELGWAITTVDLDSNRGGDLAISAPFAPSQLAAGGPRPNGGKVFVLLADSDDVPPLVQPPIVQVTAPNGMQVLNGGSTFNITWTASDPNGDDTIQSFEIRLSIDGGTNFNTIIASNLPGTARSFTWTVNSGINSNTARIRVVARDATNATGQDNSDANFTITDPGVSVHLLTPNGGQMLTFGQTFKITWEVPVASEALVKGFDLFLSTDGGTTFNTSIKSDPINPALAKEVREFDWVVPSNVCSSTARVLVVATSTTGARSSDASDTNFSTVAPGPSINTAAIELDETLSRIVLRTIPPPIGSEILFAETATLEISTTEAGTAFATFSKPFKFKKQGKLIISKGTINGMELNAFFPDGATRILRVTNPPCGITVLRIRRQGGVFVIAPPPAG